MVCESLDQARVRWRNAIVALNEPLAKRMENCIEFNCTYLIDSTETPSTTSGFQPREISTHLFKRKRNCDDR